MVPNDVEVAAPGVLERLNLKSRPRFGRNTRAKVRQSARHIEQRDVDHATRRHGDTAPRRRHWRKRAKKISQEKGASNSKQKKKSVRFCLTVVLVHRTVLFFCLLSCRTPTPSLATVGPGDHVVIEAHFPRFLGGKTRQKPRFWPKQNKNDPSNVDVIVTMVNGPAALSATHTLPPSHSEYLVLPA